MALGWHGQYIRYREFFLNISSLYKQRADLRAFLEVILSLSTVILFLLFALRPTALTIISLLQEIKEKQTTIASLNQKLSNLKTANTVFEENQSNIPIIETSIATSPEPNLITHQLELLGVKNSVNVLGISVGQIILVGTAPVKKSSTDVKPMPGGARDMPLSFSISGNFPNLLAFIRDLENLRTIIRIDTVTINSSHNNNEQVITAAISGRVPYLGKQ
ncbi:MAG TPA: hypothetical protein VL401_00795 [Alphaproteobacteria bacterium]|jgi:hypothetical protein|nr:hypothetical protein [Alphaproteobacteria bacterium]